jgi:hypothetical protein
MATCTARFNSKKTKAILKDSFQKYVNHLMKHYGGLPENAWINYQKDFKRGFMKACKTQKQKTNKNKTTKNRNRNRKI